MITQRGLNRLAEPSTWAGIAILMQAFGVPMVDGDMGPFVQGGVGVAGLLSIFLREKVKKNAVPFNEVNNAGN